MTTDRESAAAMVSACADANVKLGVAYHLRWHAGHRALHADAQAGALGTLRHMRVQWPMQSGPKTGVRRKNWPPVVPVRCWNALPRPDPLVRARPREKCAPAPVDNQIRLQRPTRETAVPHEFAGGATAEMCNSVLFPGPLRMEVYGSTGFAV